MRRYIGILTVILLFLTMAIGVSAASGGEHVVDMADLLSGAQETKLEEKLEEIGQEHGIDLVVVTTDSLGGKSPMNFADDYYDYNGYGEDGVLLLVSIEDRDWYISTSGRCIDRVDYEDLSAYFLEDLRAGDYYEAFCQFADGCDEAMQPKYLLVGVICLAIGLVVGIITVSSMKGQLKTVRASNSAADYVRSGSLQLTSSRDIFLYVNRTRVAKPKNNGGSHSGSSGRSHGGGGGKF